MISAKEVLGMVLISTGFLALISLGADEAIRYNLMSIRLVIFSIGGLVAFLLMD